METVKKNKNLLVTAFDAFGGEPINPSAMAMEMLPESIDDVYVEKLLLPTVFGESLEKLEEAIDRLEPDAVICLGQAGGRAEITPERVAINIIDARIADNAGQQLVDEPIAKDGDTAYFSTLPVKAMVSAMKEAGLPSSLSNTAGTFVCNYIMYGLLHHLRTKKAIRGGFIHVPFIPEQLERNPGNPALEIEEIVRGLKICLETVVKYETDINVSEGSEF